MDYNLSWNCGVEGPTDNLTVEKLRKRQVKNFLTINLLSLGTPMILMGDEVRRTQRGNNNAYCQDNELSWFDWSLPHAHADIHRFLKKLIFARLRRDAANDHGMTLNQIIRESYIEWHGIRLNQPDWSPDSHSIAITAWSLSKRIVFYMMMNAYWEPLEFELPPVSGSRARGWRRWIDTYRESPDDICDFAGAPLVKGAAYHVHPHSIVVLHNFIYNKKADKRP
jgi:glycogen operon protein